MTHLHLYSFDCNKFATYEFVYRTSDAPLWQDQEETVPHHKNRNMSVQDKETSGRVASTVKHETVPSNKSASGSCFLQRDKELAAGADHIKSASSRKRHKRLHSSDSVEKFPAKLSCKTKVGETSENGQSATSVCTKPVDCSVEEKQLLKPKRPAENLTIGTLFDLASYLDAARKTTRRDFDSDSVLVIRQLNEGSHLLHIRPEFNRIETSASSSVDELGDSNMDTSPLPLCHTDSDCAVRLGVLIAETIEQHIDVKKLEQTAKSVSHRLQRGTTKSSEREIVCRQRPVLISTVPRTASVIRDKLQMAKVEASRTPKVSHDRQQPVGLVSAKYRQNVLHASNAVQPSPTSVSGGCGSVRGTVDVGRDRHSHVMNNIGSSDLCQSVTSSTDGTLNGSGDVQTVRRIIIGRKRNTDVHLQPDSSSRHDDSSKRLKEDSGSDVFDYYSLLVGDRLKL